MSGTDTPTWFPNDTERSLRSTGHTSPGVSIPEHGRSALLEAIVSDPRRKPFEKETSVTMNADTDVCQLTSAEPGIMRRLVLHPHIRLRWLEVATDTGTRTMDCEEFDSVCSTTDSPPTIPSVHAVSVIGPVGILKVSVEPRSTGGHAMIVSDNVLENDPR